VNLNSLLEGTTRKFADKDAIVYGDTALTYAELLDAARRAASVFRDAGVKPGDRVGVMAYNTPAFVIAAFGIWRAGAALVPINHKLTRPEVAYLTEHSALAVAVVDDALADRARDGAPGIRWLVTNDEGTGEFDTLVAGAEPWDGVEVAETDIGQVLYTSGTTSSPKGCLHTHRGLCTVPAYTTATVGLQRDDRFLIALPIWHASPLNNWFLSMIFMGGTVVLMKEYHPIEFLKTIERQRVTAFFGAPIAYLAPLQVAKAQGIDLSSFDLSSVQHAYGSDNFYQV
jgi:feruloyl-CoA synthase